jgi:Peptidase S46
MNNFATRFTYFTMVAALVIAGGCSSYQATTSGPQLYFNPDTVTASRFDNGKMWTFDNPPVHYFREEYKFSPDSTWFADTRLAALRLPGCSASFISQDGLVLTNHHCARYALDKVNRAGEDLPDSGFYAPTLADERKVEGMYADQLVLINDVTGDVQKAFETGKTDEEKIANGNAEIRRLEKEYREKFKESDPADSMIFQVVTFYNGGQFSLYGYHRYTDIRLVFAPQMIVAYFGGDYDNFTYPRYDLDCAMFRVYGNDGKPLHSKNYFSWSDNGAAAGEPVFVIGNPGRTGRLISMDQLKFNRDYAYPYTVNLLENRLRIYSDFIAQHPDMRMKYQTRLFGISNSLKAYGGMLGGLRDPYLMTRKEAFEREFKAEVEKNPALEEKYGEVWEDLSKVEAAKSDLFYRHMAADISGPGSSAYLRTALRLVQYARAMELPAALRPGDMTGENLATFKSKFFPSDFNPVLEKELLEFQLADMQSVPGEKDDALTALLSGESAKDAADRLAGKTSLGDSAEVAAMLDGEPGAILNSQDPLIRFVLATQTRFTLVQSEYNKLLAEETSDNLSLGRALYEVYGAAIPPDATFTLRIADGVVEGYSYNGTIAPTTTTFYGMYDRYYSFNKEYPWSLPSAWQNPPADFNLSTPLDFVMTSDIIGGNSGSAVINEKRQLVGLIFDGNIESLPGNFIYVPSVNRAVAVHSDAIPQALKYIYHADRIVNEIKAGRITE